MGVRGLLAFVESNSRALFIPQKLEDVSVVIDGYNILHELYYLSSAETAFGGDYDVFAKNIEVFCNRLRAFNVVPFFVFDGASELNDHKFQTSLQRAKERIHLAGISTHRKRTKILPCLAFRVSLHNNEV